ncbi:MAG: hypothetical protein ACF8XB_06630 [Planctomycetota bacterium JB042]
MSARVAWVGLIVAAAFAVGMVVERFSSTAEQAAAAESALTKELAGIRGLLERIAKQAEGGGGLAQVPEPLLRAPARLVEGLLEQAQGGGGGEMRAKDPAVDQALRELYDKVKEEGAQTREMLRANGVVALSELRAAKPTPDMEALTHLAGLFRQDAAAAQRTLLLARVDEAVARFGVPDEVWPQENGMSLAYYRPGTTDTWVELRVRGGYVTYVGCESE